MTKRKRTILFLGFLILFLSIAPVIILYSQGYRFDWENKKITQTGGLFLKITPKSADIYVESLPSQKKIIEEKTDFFFGSALIQNLLPKKYKIQVKKDGHQSWEKTLEIKEKEVTGAKNIILIPEKLDFTVLSKNVENFWLSPNERKIILKEKRDKKWELNVYETEKEITSRLIKEEDISRKGVEFIDLKFSSDSKKVLLKVFR